MKIGLFFGSFNPIHMGHLIIGRILLNQTDLEKIRFIVSPQNPLKSRADLIDEDQRYKMVQMAIEDEPGFECSDIEFSLPQPSYTAHTLSVLREKHPKDELVLIMGGDNLQHFDKWKDHEEILIEHEIYCYHREGNITGEFFKNKKVRVVRGPMLNISSTYVRQMMRMGKSIKYMVPTDVEKYLLNLETPGAK